MSDEKHKGIAIHEGGHALAAIRFNMAVGVVEVLDEPNEQDQGGFALVEDSPFDVTPENVMGRVIVNLAGYAALKALGYPESVAMEGVGSDFEMAQELIEAFGLPDIDHCKAQAVKFLEQAENLRALEELWPFLLKYRRVSSDAVELIIDYADGLIEAEELQSILSCSCGMEWAPAIPEAATI